MMTAVVLADSGIAGPAHGWVYFAIIVGILVLAAIAGVVVGRR